MHIQKLFQCAKASIYIHGYAVQATERVISPAQNNYFISLRQGEKKRNEKSVRVFEKCEHNMKIHMMNIIHRRAQNTVYNTKGCDTFS
jgi:hypothetical protein